MCFGSDEFLLSGAGSAGSDAPHPAADGAPKICGKWGRADVPWDVRRDMCPKGKAPLPPSWKCSQAYNISSGTPPSDSFLSVSPASPITL